MDNGDQGTVVKHQLEDIIKILNHVMLKYKASFKLCDDFNRTLKSQNHQNLMNEKY